MSPKTSAAAVVKQEATGLQACTLKNIDYSHHTGVGSNTLNECMSPNLPRLLLDGPGIERRNKPHARTLKNFNKLLVTHGMIND